ncbi:xaa-Pro aminopeptidase 1-like [Diadema antillarum]|uniref:xaa-Pro aminopeptidase 1-like n=1 Tax=Diadema antillarum TaxID=105358 RepID=UPI003A8C21D1
MKVLIALCFIALAASPCWSEPIALFDGERAPPGVLRPAAHQKKKREVTADVTERDCSDPANPVYPSTTVNVTAQLTRIRELMVTANYGAYIVPSEDAHGSEYIAARDQRRQYISGFSGSSGIVLITQSHAALWTDGRYYLQADRELLCDYMLMRSGEEGVPTTAEWLVSTSTDPTMGANLPDGSQIGYDPTLLSISSVQSYLDTVANSGRNLAMVSSLDNLVDQTWEELDDIPPYPGQNLLVLGVEYSGQAWDDKIVEIREMMMEESVNATHLIVTKLDEVAWLFNLRGEDIPYNPMFISYAIVGLNDVWLYVYDKARRVDADDNVRAHLKLTTPCTDDVCVTVLDYPQFDIDLPNLDGHTIWFSDVCSYFIYQSVPEEKQLIQASPILLMKAQKNPTEVDGMKLAHKYDSIALCKLGTWLQKTMDSLEDKENGNIDELSELIVMDKAVEFRQAVSDTFAGLSFGTISSFGPNGAVIHYTSSEETNTAITNQGIFLLDSGGQYYEGTCDITRSFHFGTPTAFMKEAYTRVLMGHIDLVTAVWRTNVYGRELDIRARQPLFENGLDYKHGTGHGIGHYLNVHEGPASISLGYSSRHKPIYPGMFFSDEPGYYEDGEFGIRLENVMYAVEAETQHHFEPAYTYMTFDMISFVPFEPNLIDFSLMTQKQIEYYNEYNEMIRSFIGPELTEDELAWVMSKTEYVNPTTGSAPPSLATSLVVLCAASLSALLFQ